MSIDEDFAEFVAARWAPLYRLAYLLAASPAGAEDLLQTTLEKAYMDWSRIGRMEYAEAYVRRMLAHTSGVQPTSRLDGASGRPMSCPRRWGTPPRSWSSTGGCSGHWSVRCRHPAGSHRAALLRGPE